MNSSVHVEGYKWFGKPRTSQNSLRKEGGVGFLVRDCLVYSSVKYDESVWMKVHGGRGRSALFAGCLYMPSESASVAVVDSCYDTLKEDVLGFRQNGTVLQLGDFNARVGRSVDVDDVMGMFGEDTCNACENRWMFFLHVIVRIL